MSDESQWTDGGKLTDVPSVGIAGWSYACPAWVVIDAHDQPLRSGGLPVILRTRELAAHLEEATRGAGEDPRRVARMILSLRPAPEDERRA